MKLHLPINIKRMVYIPNVACHLVVSRHSLYQIFKYKNIILGTLGNQLSQPVAALLIGTLGNQLSQPVAVN